MVPPVSLEESMVEFFSIQQSSKSVPKYNGSNIPFAAYQHTIDTIFKNVPDNSEDKFIQVVIAKLEGPAHDAVIYKEIKTVAELLNCLRTRFCTQRPSAFYQGRLNNLCKFPDEPIVEYGVRAQRYVSDGTAAINREVAVGQRENAIALLTSGAISSFVRGLPTEYIPLLNEPYATLKAAIDGASSAERRLREREEIRGNMEYERRLYRNINNTRERNNGDRRNYSEDEQPDRRPSNSRYEDNYRRNTYYRNENRPRYPQERYPRDFRDDIVYDRRPRTYTDDTRYSNAQVLFCKICRMNNHATINCRRNWNYTQPINQSFTRDDRRSPSFPNYTNTQQNERRGILTNPSFQRYDRSNMRSQEPQTTPNQSPGPSAIPHK